MALPISHIYWQNNKKQTYKDSILTGWQKTAVIIDGTPILRMHHLQIQR